MKADSFRQILRILVVKGIISEDEFDIILSLKDEDYLAVEQYIEDKMERGGNDS